MYQPFPIHTYTKKALALLYFPESKSRTATNHLLAWIKRCPDLWHELQEMGYNKNAKLFTPREVRAIVHHLGEP